VHANKQLSGLVISEVNMKSAVAFLLASWGE